MGCVTSITAPPVEYWTLLGLIIYVSLVRTLRYRWRDKQKAKYQNRQSLSSISVNDAWVIVKELVELEFPHMMGLSIGFALYKVCQYALRAFQD